ncbi:hypothetical protein Daus18300_014447 [Diaporthe australafricana]|uniref:Major facilitator superfamily transporter n=1 Tax=Diaporthe australafricana TaxID=127596 RepID=A0ABR3VV58_9PEZI
MLAGIIATTFIGFVFFVLIFNLPLRSQTVNLDSPSTASVRLLPMLGALAVGSFLGGAASSKVNRTFHTFVAGTGLVTLGVGLLSTISHGLEVDKKLYGFEVIAGFGIGLTFSTVSLMTTKETEAQDHAVAQGIVSQVRVFGGSIGVAAANAMLRLEAQTHLAGILSSAQIRELQASPTVIESLSPTQRDAVRGAYAYAFSGTMRICVYMGSVAFLACLFTFQRFPRKSKREVRT